MHGLVHACSSLQSVLWMWTYAWHPKVQSMLRSGLFLCHASKGDVSGKAAVGVAFTIQIRSLRASPQKEVGSLACCSMAMTPSVRVQFVCSAIPFCCSVPLVVCLWVMPFVLKWVSHFWPINSPPLSSLNVWIFWLVWFSACASKSRYASNALSFDLRR